MNDTSQIRRLYEYEGKFSRVYVMPTPKGYAIHSGPVMYKHSPVAKTFNSLIGPRGAVAAFLKERNHLIRHDKVTARSQYARKNPHIYSNSP